MSSFNSTTSRRALILGMTNSDQVGMQQAKAPAAATIPDHAERIPDAGDTGGGGDGGGEVNEATGLNAIEQAEFERMSQGDGEDPEPPPAGDAPADDEIDVEDDDDEPVIPDPAPAPLGREKTPEELAAEAAVGKKTAPKTVSYGKYQRELKKANETAATAQAAERKAREDAIKLAERVAIINEALSAAPAPVADPNAPPANPFEEEDIDPTVDYAESVKQIQRRQRFQMENQGRVEQTITETNEDRAMKDTFTRDFQVQAGTNPELPAAYQFLKDSRLTEICISEFDKDPNDPEAIFTKDEVAKMVQMFNAEEKWVVGNAIKQGKSPAQAILKLARARGFKKPEAAPARAAAPAAPAAPAARVPAVRNGNGAPPAPAAPSAAQALAELAAAKAAGVSLSDGGGAPPQGLSAEILLAMDDDEFAELVDQLPKHQLDALMGRAPS